jgi:hypothetical protein
MGLTFAVAILLGALASPPAVRAETDEFPDSGGGEAVPAWSVARLKVVDGSAWLSSPDDEDWQEIDGNAPLSKGARVQVPEGSTADVYLNGGTRVRLRAGADLELRDLRENRASLTLSEGRAGFVLPEDDFLEPVNVTLPDGQIVRFAKAGSYRLTVGGIDEESVVQVRSGEARVKIGDVKYRIRAGEEGYIDDTVSIGRLADASPGDEEPPPPAMNEVESSVEAPPTVVYELQDYGEWVTVPSYGPCWRPRVAAGWSPYYFGRWAWVDPLGWSWVSSEPWGWYPYRCGNWFLDPVLGWCWSPRGAFVSVSWTSGHRYYRPAGYYPATVRFVREGGSVRWVPLRPGERFGRNSIPRGDHSLGGWRQPIPRQTVFVREPRRGGAPVWRDAHVDRPDRRPPAKPAPVVRTPRNGMPSRVPGEVGRPPRSDRGQDRRPTGQPVIRGGNGGESGGRGGNPPRERRFSPPDPSSSRAGQGVPSPGRKIEEPRDPGAGGTRTNPRPEVNRPVPRPDAVRPVPRPEPRIAPRPETRPEPRVERRPEPKVERRPEPKVERRPEPQVEPVRPPVERPAPNIDRPRVQEPREREPREDRPQRDGGSDGGGRRGR